jgi:hypothetical protein
LLYGITLVMYLVMPRGCYAATRQACWSSVVLFVFLAAIGASYSIPWYATVGTAVAGIGSVALAFRIQSREGELENVVGKFTAYLAELCERDADALRALKKQGFSLEALAEVKSLIARRRALLEPSHAPSNPELVRVELDLSEEALWDWYFRWRAMLRQRFSP